jgi:glycine/D-amino acid oxidase-like deaminating enzyme
MHRDPGADVGLSPAGAAPHAPSWYAATRNDDTAYPRLEGECRADVAVVGGGFTGVSAALHLAERGYSVALVEARRIGWGASGRNGGQLIDGFVDAGKIGKRLGPDAADLVRRMRRASRDLVVERIRRYSIDCDLKYGFLYLAKRPAEFGQLEAEYEELRRDGYPHEICLVARNGLREYLATDHYLGGLFNAGNGHLHPLNLCLGEARAASSLGAAVFERSRAVRIRHGRRVSIETDRGRVVARIAVLAGNAYLAGLEPALRGLVVPAGSYIVATEVLDAATVESLFPADVAFCEYCVGLNYFRRSADRRLLFGGMCNYSGRDPKSIEQALRPRLARVFPQLGDVRIDFEWGGKIGISINRIPQLGRIGENVYYAQGYSGHGLAPAHLAGRVLADAIAGDSAEFELLRRIRHWRLPGGPRFANPALALGMLYYRLRELF